MSSVVEEAGRLVGVIGEGREEADRTGVLARPVVAACREAGLFAMAAPVEVGGPEATPVEIFDAIELVASVDPSVAWYMLNSLPVGRAAAWIASDHWDEIYTKPLGNYGFSAAVTGRFIGDGDGYRLSGVWPLMTGVLDADWALVFGTLEVEDSSRPAVRYGLIPTSELVVTEIWQDAVAMRGTGSHRVGAESIQVPGGLLVEPASPPRLNRPSYRAGTFVPTAYANSAVPVGILRSAVTATADELRGKVSSIFRERSERSTALLEMMSEASLAMDHLHYGVRAALELVWQHLQRGEVPPAGLRATVIGGQFRAADVARDLISGLYARSSSAAFFQGHPLERALRDIHAVAYALETLRPLQHDAGRIALGLDPVLPGY